MRFKVVATTLAFTLSGSVALAAEPTSDEPAIPTRSSEPTKRFRLIGESGFEVMVRQAVELCAGTVDAVKTVACFIEAWSHPGISGLGLTLGQAVDLCRTIPREGP